MIDVVIINCGSQRDTHGNMYDMGLTAIEPPVWARLIASYLVTHQMRPMIIDADALDLSPTVVAQMIASAVHKPALIVIPVYGQQPSASTQKMPVTIAQ